jgi:hypothetical protein
VPRLSDAHFVASAAVRIAVRASGLERPAWQVEMLRRLRAVPGVEVVETHEPRPLLPADVFLDPNESALSSLGAPYPRLGYWRFIYGPEGRLSHSCTREHEQGERGAMARLVCIAADGSATELECGVIKAVTHSLARTRERLRDVMKDWPTRSLRRILNEPFHEVRGAAARVASTPVALAAGYLPDAPSILSTVRGYARRVAQESVEEHWTLGVIRKPVHHVIDSFNAGEIHWLTPPKGGAIADPLGAIERDGTLTILAESYGFADRRGRIVTLDVQNESVVRPPREVLPLPVHASYPHLISYGTHIYCLPEISAAGCVQLYRADPFPDRWVPDRVLLQSFAGTDATVHYRDDRWWMFVGNHADQDEAKLCIFHAPDLFGPWQPHAMNPVKCDLRSARPAGPLFAHGGTLYRPAQDGSATYGGAVAVNRVTKLSPGDFAEETVNVLRPAPEGPFPHGLHTLTGVGNFTLVDGKRHARSLRRLAWGLRLLARGPG